MNKLKSLLLGMFLLSMPALAHAQTCSGQPAGGYVCGNGLNAQALPGFYPQSTLLDAGFGSGQGTVLNRTGSGWVATVAPSLGRNGGTGGSLTLNGSTSGSAIVSVPAAAGSVLFQLPGTNGSNNQVLTTDGSGHLSWVSLTGTGTVTSVGLSMPGIFAVTGSPVTTNGTLTAALNTQSANTVWAGPSTGSASAPTFRSLVGADLPTPTTGSLGGVQANTAVSHQWINAVNTSGVPQLSQPAFTDISGTASGSQLPNPSASTLGGIESYAAVSHQWINQISTSGVPSSTQPNFSDLAGSASPTQLPVIGNNTVLGNNSGSTSTPLTLSGSNVLDMVGSVQGDILYRDVGGWNVLTPGVNGQVLTTSGASANPTWTTVTGTGTVTQINSGTGISLSPSSITTTGSVNLAAIATGNVLANVSGSSAAPTATAPSSVLDVVGATQGNVLYRGASTWSALAPGTSGQFLQTRGSGSTPQWASAVTSVGLTAGNSISLSGTNPITSSGSIGVAWNAPHLGVYLPTSVNETSGSPAVVPMSSVIVDSAGWYNTSTYTYTPQLAGSYLVTVKTRCGSTSTVSTCVAYIYKNGVAYAINAVQFGTASILDGQITGIVSMNGTTDTIQPFTAPAGTGTVSFQGGTGPILTTMSITYVGP